MCIRRAKGKHENACFYLVEGSVFKLICWRMLYVPKKLVMGQSIGDGPIKWLLLEEGKT
jgi:hypothetical protein